MNAKRPARRTEQREKRTVSWRFKSADGRAAHAARSAFAAFVNAIAGRDVETLAAEMVIGELVGNVARHAPGPVDLEAEFTDQHVVISVTDRGPGFALALDLPTDPLIEHGRGLFLVAMQSTSLAVRRVRSKCRVRAVVPLALA